MLPFDYCVFAVLPAAGASDGQACGACDESKGRRAEVGPAGAGDRDQAREGKFTNDSMHTCCSRCKGLAVVAAAAAAVLLVRGRLQQALPVTGGNIEYRNVMVWTTIPADKAVGLA